MKLTLDRKLHTKTMSNNNYAMKML